MVASNHIHLLAPDNPGNAIPKSTQLIAGRTGQKFNQRKSTKGAFREDRYYATAVETSGHLIRCIVYMELKQ